MLQVAFSNKTLVCFQKMPQIEIMACADGSDVYAWVTAIGNRKATLQPSLLFVHILFDALT